MLHVHFDLKQNACYAIAYHYNAASTEAARKKRGDAIAR